MLEEWNVGGKIGMGKVEKDETPECWKAGILESWGSGI